MADQRHVVDHLPKQAEAYLAEALVITGKRIRGTEWLMELGLGHFGLGLGERRPHAGR